MPAETAGATNLDPLKIDSRPCTRCKRRIGCDDDHRPEWANQRLSELQHEKAALEPQEPALKKPPKLTAGDVTEYTRNLSGLLGHANQRERKELVGMIVEKIKLAPERREVELVYRAPEPVMNRLVAGVRYGARQRNLGGEFEVIELAFEPRGNTLVLVGAAGG